MKMGLKIISELPLSHKDKESAHFHMLFNFSNGIMLSTKTTTFDIDTLIGNTPYPTSPGLLYHTSTELKQNGATIVEL